MALARNLTHDTETDMNYLIENAHPDGSRKLTPPLEGRDQECYNTEIMKVLPRLSKENTASSSKMSPNDPADGEIIENQIIPNTDFAMEAATSLRERRANSSNKNVEKRRSLPLREIGAEIYRDAGPSVDWSEIVKGNRRRESDLTERVLKLAPEKLYELTSSPDAVPVHVQEVGPQFGYRSTKSRDEQSMAHVLEQDHWQTVKRKGHGRKRSGSASDAVGIVDDKVLRSPIALPNGKPEDRPLNSRTASSPVLKRKQSSSRPSAITPLVVKTGKHPLTDSKSTKKESRPSRTDDAPAPAPAPAPSPMLTAIPLPPMSIPAYLQLELSSAKPSPLYIHRSSASEFPYESSKAKIDRLLNFLLLPWHLEGALWFGAFACLDAWLYTFTVLPLRCIKAMWLLMASASSNLVTEGRYLAYFVYSGLGRLWRRKRSSSVATDRSQRGNVESKDVSTPSGQSIGRKGDTDGGSEVVKSFASNEPNRKRAYSRHKRVRSAPSNLLPGDKADILKGLLILTSCAVLMYFDASMMYHSIRGQAAIKLYVIYNVLEVFDRLFSAIGQDVLECLFSKEALERKPDGRSKILRPSWLFLLALVYNIIHATALFYQVITLNVAVNSYSNALLTLLLSNQFVEIKSTVFKKFEKENLFQMTCADIVERFQLWLMLIIIASRNIIETNTLFSDSSAVTSRTGILPSSFTMLPEWTGQVMGPFFLVLGTETIVDWLKHAYISKFNLVKPNIYGRFLDVLAKDYYTNAFADQNLTKRLGLPVIPLSCLFIRASVQTYQMFLAIHLPRPLPSPSNSLSDPDSSTSPATTAALLHIDQLFRRALGRHLPASTSASPLWGIQQLPSPDVLLAWLTTLLFWALVYLVMLTLKLLLGMILLRFARNRYAGMKLREQESTQAEGRRVGGWGMVEVDEDKRRWIYEGDSEALRRLKEKEREVKEREKGGEKGLGHVERYSMVAKRIW